MPLNCDACEKIKIESKDPYSKDEIKAVVEIHMQTFTGFFLTFMGRGFLYELYRGFSKHSKSGLILAKEDDKIVGFLAYSEELSNFYKYLIKRRLIQFAWYSLGAFLRKPKIFMRLIRAFLKPSESKREEKYVELSSIGVSPEKKNMNIGSCLIDELYSRFEHKEYEYIKLETDAENNDGANHFYQKNGFVLGGTYTTHEGRKMNEYRRSL